MQDNNIKIRPAVLDDCYPVFEWRNDKSSREMSLDDNFITFTDHSSWFKSSLQSEKRTLYIGEQENKKIGVCRFDLNLSEFTSDVSINMNPEMRNRGLGKAFLSKCITNYWVKNDYDLLAKIRSQNLASLKIFKSVGFEEYSYKDEVVFLTKSFNNLKFKAIEETDADTLFEILEKRPHSISHKVMPSKSEHIAFIKSNPYRYWFLVFEDDQLAGAIYIQNDNSIGLNLLFPKKTLVRKILGHLKTNFDPKPEVKSKVPDYFYLNVSYSNEDLKEILDELGVDPIQLSYKVI